MFSLSNVQMHCQKERHLIPETPFCNLFIFFLHPTSFFFIAEILNPESRSNTDTKIFWSF
jgi:hypothetical protein